MLHYKIIFFNPGFSIFKIYSYAYFLDFADTNPKILAVFSCLISPYCNINLFVFFHPRLVISIIRVQTKVSIFNLDLQEYSHHSDFISTDNISLLSADK